MVSKEHELFSKLNLTPYRGKYVVLSKRKVVGSGINAEKVLTKAKSKYPKKKLVLMKVPEKELMVLVIR